MEASERAHEQERRMAGVRGVSHGEGKNTKRRRRRWKRRRWSCGAAREQAGSKEELWVGCELGARAQETEKEGEREGKREEVAASMGRREEHKRRQRRSPRSGARERERETTNTFENVLTDG